MWVIFALIGLLVVFCALCIVCDEHLVPAVQVFIEQFEVPEEVAAVTLVAFGSAAPEILLNTVSAVEKSSSLSLPAVLGSAMIAFGLIPAASLLFSPHKSLKLRVWPILRETIFYIVGLSLFLKVISDSITDTLEALCMASVYFIYVGSVIGLHLYKTYKQAQKKKRKETLLRFLRTSSLATVEEEGENMDGPFDEDHHARRALLQNEQTQAVEDLESPTASSLQGFLSKQVCMFSITSYNLFVV